MDKPAGEYRIALLGDSYTGPNAVYIRWADLVQDYLNRSPDWRAFVGDKFTRVLNFGVGGTGIEQWGREYENFVSRFFPDLVIGNFIREDVRRRFLYKGSYNFKSSAEMREYITNRVDHDMVDHLPWFEFYPELLAGTLGPYLGLIPHMTPAAAVNSNTSIHFDNPEKAMQIALASIKAVRCLNPNFIVLMIPQAKELSPGDDEMQWAGDSFMIGLKAKFLGLARQAGIDIVDFKSLYPEYSDPNRIAFRAITALYNFDGHFSDYGVTVYASWVFRYLIERIRLPVDENTAGRVSCR